VGRLILRRGEQKDPRASRPRRRKPGTRKTPPSHVDQPSPLNLTSSLPSRPLPRSPVTLLSLLSARTIGTDTDLADAFIHVSRDEPSPKLQGRNLERYDAQPVNGGSLISGDRPATRACTHRASSRVLSFLTITIDPPRASDSARAEHVFFARSERMRQVYALGRARA
jgi:hypothetical protein